jgi:NNP family nitrate/nitrite transporter-like MFS transporter
MAPTKTGLNLLDLADPKVRTLHFSWFAFFLTFVLWFNHPPLLAYIRETLHMSEAQVRALLTLNVALTIPARILVGIFVDRFGPRAVFSALLVLGSLVCFGFASAQSFEQLALARFAMGFVGAGFVIGIRLVGEWFPARQVGLAEGIYGGWGNFGAAAASLALPSLALLFGKEEGWRWAVAATGLASLLYAFVFYTQVRNTPRGSTYFKPRRTGGLEVTSRADFFFCLAMNLPLYAALAVLAWNLSPARIGLISTPVMLAIWTGLAALCALHFSQIYRVNREMLKQGVPEIYRYRFKQVAVLDLVYLVTFGSELAVVSVLPLYFLDTFAGLDPVTAGLLASPFAFMNLGARPGGGWLSDRFGRRRTLALLLAGLTLGYLMLGQLSGAWPIALAVLATVACSVFVHAGNGAVFAVVPLVQRRMTGQIAGMVGAYGNVGGVFFLTVFSFVDYSTFFHVIAASALLGLLALPFLDEPRGHVAEVNEDGSVELIEVA